jgi:hypothetical protein
VMQNVRKVPIMPEGVLCESCLNRLWPETVLVAPGQNIRCDVGYAVNKRIDGSVDSWVFQQISCQEYEKSGTRAQNKAWKILAGGFDDLDEPGKIVCSVVEFRKWLWQKHSINKKEFQRMLEDLRDDKSPFRFRIHLYGGTTAAYTKTNFVEVHGKKYLVFTIETLAHQKYMEGHRG